MVLFGPLRVLNADCLGIEIDLALPPKVLKLVIFDLKLSEQFDTIIGNPYVRFQMLQWTPEKLKSGLLMRNNLFYSSKKCIRHLKSGNGFYRSRSLAIKQRILNKATSHF